MCRGTPTHATREDRATGAVVECTTDRASCVLDWEGMLMADELQQLAERLFCLLAPSRNEDHPDAARDLQDSFFGRRGPLSCFVRARQEGRIFWTLEEIKAIFSSPFLDVSSRLCLTASASLSRCPSSCLLLTSLSSGLSRDKERKRNVLLPQNFLRLVREQWNAGLGEITRAHMGALARAIASTAVAAAST